MGMYAHVRVRTLLNVKHKNANRTQMFKVVIRLCKKKLMTAVFHTKLCQMIVTLKIVWKLHQFAHSMKI